MFVARRLNPKITWFFAWRNLLRTAVLSITVYLAYEWLDWKFVSIPFLPVATIGTAVAFYIGFKNNSAYERLWEARRIWRGIVNQSRSFAVLILETIREQKPESNKSIHETRKRLIYRHLAWVCPNACNQSIMFCFD